MALQNMAFKLELLTDLGTCKAGYSPVREKWNLGCTRQQLIYQPHRQSECFLHTVPVTTHLPCEHMDWPEFCLHGPSDVYQPSCMTEYGSSLHFTFDWEGSNSKNQIWLGVGVVRVGGKCTYVFQLYIVKYMQTLHTPNDTCVKPQPLNHTQTLF